MKERALYFAEYLCENDFDIVGLQEVFQEWHANLLIENCKVILTLSLSPFLSISVSLSSFLSISLTLFLSPFLSISLTPSLPFSLTFPLSLFISISPYLSLPLHLPPSLPISPCFFLFLLVLTTFRVYFILQSIYSYSHWTRNGMLGSPGLLLLSKHPIVSAKYLEFRLNGYPQEITKADKITGNFLIFHS